MLKIIKILKKIPFDFNQYELRDRSKAKTFAFELATPESRPAGKALDIGCRDGFWSERLKLFGYEVESIDLEPVYQGCRVVDANKALPFTDGFFDLVWSSEVLEHLEDPIFSVSEMRRVLKPKGKIIITTPNSQCWVFRLFVWLGISMAEVQNPGHKQFFSLVDMQRIFPTAKIYGFFPYFLVKKIISSPRLISLLSPTFIVHTGK